jgi:ATP-dependent Lon protease
VHEPRDVSAQATLLKEFVVTEQVTPTSSNGVLAQKIREVLAEVVIDKCRLPASKLRERGIPGYVAEWVLDYVVPGEGPLTPEEARTVQEWAVRYIPKADEQNLVRDRLLRGEMVKLLTPLQVDVIVSRRSQGRVGKLTFLDINDAIVSEDLTEHYPELLKGGMWGRVDLLRTGNGVLIADFQPMQAQVDLELWKEARREFTLDEWRSLLLLSMGYAPEAYSAEAQTWLICRLLPLVQKNLCLMELAPKGTGKSYVYQNISPKVRVVSGGNISPAVLFVNNANNVPGILARFSLVVLDEVQKLKFEHPEEIVGTLKGYLANGVIGRGGKNEMASDCSLVLLANILLDEELRPIPNPLVSELPHFLQETAFLDRIGGIIPGWEIPKLTSTSLTQSVGLKTDFFGNILLALRDDLMADHLCDQRIRSAGPDDLERNNKPVRALASGLMKLLFPHGECSDEELYRYCVLPAVRMRQLVWHQLYTLDGEFRQYSPELRYQVVYCADRVPDSVADSRLASDPSPSAAVENGLPSLPLDAEPPTPDVDPFAQRLEVVAAHYPDFAESIAQARGLAATNPESALVHLRKAIEAVIRELYRKRLGKDAWGVSLFDMTRELEDNRDLSDVVIPHVHTVRSLGNVGAHPGDAKVTAHDVEIALQACIRVGEWLSDLPGGVA